MVEEGIIPAPTTFVSRQYCLIQIGLIGPLPRCQKARNDATAETWVPSPKEVVGEEDPDLPKAGQAARCPSRQDSFEPSWNERKPSQGPTVTRLAFLVAAAVSAGTLPRPLLRSSLRLNPNAVLRIVCRMVYIIAPSVVIHSIAISFRLGTLRVSCSDGTPRHVTRVFHRFTGSRRLPWCCCRAP